MSVYESTVKEPYERHGYTWYEADFHDLSQMQLFLLEDPPIHSEIFTEVASINGGNKFHGVPLEQAVSYLISGYSDNYDQFLSLRQELSRALEIKIPRRRYIKSQVGSRVHMANFVANKPKYMLRLEPAPIAKIANIHFNLSYPQGEDAVQIRHRGILTLNLIKLMEMNGYHVRLNAFSLAKEDDEIIYVKVNLKSPGEILNERKCFFPFCAREFPRRLIFRIRESMPVQNEYWGYSYGSSQEANSIQELLDLPKEDIIISSPSYMGVYGGDIYDDANRFFERLNLDDSIKVKKLQKRDD